MLRAIPPDMEPAAVAGVDARLDAVEAEHGVRVLLAVESGSRAWGFASPDSDYDGRFFYVRGVDAYLTPWRPRDVIETPLDAVLDVNGWDLGKALGLILKGNAVAIEWLTSPIVYRGEAAFREGLLALARRVANRNRVALHYLHLGERQRREHFGLGAEVAGKKLFYVLRPAAALRWLRLHEGEAVAPMHFPTLMAECEPPAEVAAVTRELMARKAVTRELGTGPLPEVIRGFVKAEFEAARAVFPDRGGGVTDEARAEAEGFFREAVRRWGPG